MPTIVIGNNTGDDYSGTVGSCLYESEPTVTHFGYYDMYVGLMSDYNRNSILAINVPDLGDINVSNSRLYIYAIGFDHSATMYECLRNFNIEQATWNTYSSGNSWATPGGVGEGDIGSTQLGSYLVGDSNTYYSSSASDALNNLIGSSVNSTVRLIMPNSGNSYFLFRSQRHSDGTRPYLSVTYTESGNTYYYQQMQM